MDSSNTIVMNISKTIDTNMSVMEDVSISITEDISTQSIKSIPSTENMSISLEKEKENEKDRDVPITENQSSVKKSSRKTKQRIFYSDEKINPVKRIKKQSDIINSEEKFEEKFEKLKKPEITEDDMRKRNVERITNIFRDYIEGILNDANMPIALENSRAIALVKSMKNSFELKKKVYISKSMGYLVSSSDGTQTYTVEPKTIADTLKYMCNCGISYDSERTSCKHCGAVLFYNFDNYFNDYLNNKQNVGLQLYNIQKNLGKFDIEEGVKTDKVQKSKKTKSSKSSEKVSDLDMKVLTEEVLTKEVSIEKEIEEVLTKEVQIEKGIEKEIDFFSFVLKNKY